MMCSLLVALLTGLAVAGFVGGILHLTVGNRFGVPVTPKQLKGFEDG